MANSCYNDIKLSGSASDIEKVRQLFTKLTSVERRSAIEVAEVFFGLEPQNHYMSIIFWDEGEDLMVSYITHWIPNFQDTMKISIEFEVSFVHDAFEFNCMIYQRCIYVYGESLHFPKMNQHEFAVYDFDRDSVPYDPRDYK